MPETMTVQEMESGLIHQKNMAAPMHRTLASQKHKRTGQTEQDMTGNMEWATASGLAALPLARIGVAIGEPVLRRMLEAVALQLELEIDDLSNAAFDTIDTARYEVVIADRSTAELLHERVERQTEHADGVMHAAVVCMAAAATPENVVPLPFADAIIELPLEQAALLAHLSVVLYAHRAYTLRYEPAIGELGLNRRIFRSVPSGISVSDAADPNHPLIYVNPAFEVMTGYSLEEAQGRNCRFLQDGDRDQPARQILREAMADHRQVTVVLRNYKQDGTPFWNEMSLAPISNREGTITHFVAIQNDVTARVEYETALRESEKLVAVGRLAASIAHEINNPLEIVMNLLFLAQHETNLENARQYVSAAELEIKRVALLTTQSLKFYRQSTGPNAVSLDAIAHSVLDLYSVKLNGFHVSVHRRRSSSAQVVCMEGEIRQVLSNLVLNAVDAMRSGGGRLIVNTREMTQWSTGLRGVGVTVADTGCGIDPTSMKKLYTAFYTTKGDCGTGLGLWVSSEIVQRHLGALRCRSSQNAKWRGTVFTLFLPYGGMDRASAQEEGSASAVCLQQSSPQHVH